MIGRILAAVTLAALSVSGAHAGSLLNAEGVGRPVEGYDIAARGAGWTSIGVADEYGMSLVNPASFVWTRRPQLSLGVTNENLWIKTSEGGADRVGEIRLPFVHFVLPAPARLRFSLGYRDITDGRFETSRLVAEGAEGEHERIVNGSGSLGEFFLGAGYRGPANRFGVGVRYGIVQGTLREEFENVYENSSYRDSRSVLRTRMEDGESVEFGAQGRPLEALTLGATFRTTTDLNLRSLLRTESGYEEAFDAELEYPASFGFGVSFDATDRWTLSADLLERQWDESGFTDESGDPIVSAFGRMETTRRFGVGVTRRPDPEITAKSPLQNQIVWRLGFTTADLSAPTSTGEIISEWAVTGGIGLPIQYDRGYLDGLLEVGRRGDLEDAELRETFVRLGFGVTFQRLRRAF